MLLAGLEATDAIAVMDRCRSAIAALSIGNPQIGVSASVGVATSRPGEIAEPVSIVRAADEAVYAAKARGGNSVFAVTTGELEDPTAGGQASALRA